MLPKHRTATHPGQILLSEFLAPLGLTQVQLARHLGVSVQRVNEIVKGKRGVTAETAYFFAQAFGTSPEFWMNLQMHHDLTMMRPSRKVRPIKAAA